MKVLFMVGMLLLVSVAKHTEAGDNIVIRNSDTPFDAFAVRDQVMKDHGWQEWLRMQQQIQILQALPSSCRYQLQPYKHYLCQGRRYHPYQYQNTEVYIGSDIVKP